MMYVILTLLVINFIGMVGLAWHLIELSIEVKATLKSTHQIVVPTALAPQDSDFQAITPDDKKAFEKPFDEYRGIN